MPIKDWSKVDAGVFHSFHTLWIGEMTRVLNSGLLPTSFYALAEQHFGGGIADVLTLQSPFHSESDAFGRSDWGSTPGRNGGTAVAPELPSTIAKETIDLDILNLRRSVVIRHVSSHRVVAVMEIVSPGNKDRETSLDVFISKTLGAFQNRVHVLVIDIFAPGPFDPNGIHEAIRVQMNANLGANTSNHPRSTFVSYRVIDSHTVEAYLEFPKEGALLPSMPIFLTTERYVQVPLETTFQLAWDGMPAFWKDLIH